MSKYEVKLAAARLALAKDQEELENVSSDASDAEARYLSDWQQSDQLLRQIESHVAEERQDENLGRKKPFLEFLKKKPSTATNTETTILHSERRKLLDRMDSAATIIEKKRRLVASIEGGKDKIQKLEACIAAESERVQRLAINAQTRQAREQIARAKVAAHDKSSRDLAAQIKKRIHRQDHCPYCGNTLGSDAHADHIYPVSKGGLSTPKNLVFACGTCNMRKRDMTLAAFIRAFDLNREEIEARLFSLGKDF